MATKELSLDLHMCLWSRVKVLFGFPIKVSLKQEIEHLGFSNEGNPRVCITNHISVVVKGETPVLKFSSPVVDDSPIAYISAPE